MRFPIPLLPVCVLILAAGCSSTGSNTRPQAPTPALSPANIKPDSIYVYDLNLDLSKVQIEGKRSELIQFRSQLRSSVTRHLVEKLNQCGIPSYPYDKDLPLPTGNYWLLSGRILQVDETNNALSLSLKKNPGLHGTEVYIELANLTKPNPERIMIFDTSGQAEPPGRLDVSDAGAALDQDSSRIARLTADYLHNYFVKQGWLQAPTTESISAPIPPVRQ